MDTYKLNFTILEQELFSLLCIKAGKQFSQRELSIQLGVSPTAVGNSLSKLLKEKRIIINKTKTSNFISLNREKSKTILLKQAENIRQLHQSGLTEYFEQTLPGATTILFGSYAKGEDIHTSDIDIAVIGRKITTLNTEIFEKYLQKQININFYDSWKDIHKHLKNNILSGMVLVGTITL